MPKGPTPPLEEIFATALAATSATARQAYLEHACGDDERLTARVQALLAAHDAAGAFLQLPPELPPEDFTGGIAEQPGALVGRYKLLEQIGEGGFGVVFMAEQQQPVHRLVALKIIKAGMDTKQVVARFEAERQALAMMDHPNIAKVLDAGATETGRPYFVMELIRGTPITRYCDDSRLTIRQRLELFIPVCQAVQHAHQKGIIHRDLKPGNVLVAMHDDRAVPMIIDFGVAKAIEGKLTEQTMFTGFPQLIGTPTYMSPEQAQLSGIDVDTRSDIYSLGVLLYELLTGGTPFDARQFSSATYDDLRRMIREFEPPTPSTRLSTLSADTLTLRAGQRRSDERLLVQSLRGDLEWVVMRCLEKDRTRRYPTASGLAKDVECYLLQQPVEARPPTRLYRLQKFIRRNQWSVLAGAVVVAALVVGLALALVSFVRANQQAEIARAQALRSQQVLQVLKEILQGVDPMSKMGQDSTLLSEIADRALARVTEDLQNQPDVEAELLETLGDIYMLVGPVKKAESLQRHALSIRRDLPGDHRLEVARSLWRLGTVLWVESDHPQAEHLLRESLTVQDSLLAADDAQTVDTLIHLGGVLGWEGKLDEATLALRRALNMAQRLHGNEDQQVGRARAALGAILGRQGELVEGEALTREALAIDQKLFGEDNSLTLSATRGLAEVLMPAGKLSESEQLLQQSVDSFRRMSDPTRSSQLAWTLDDLGRALVMNGKIQQAEPCLREALAIKTRIFGKDNGNTAASRNGLIKVLRQEGKTAEADELAAAAASTDGGKPAAEQP